jgi:hypothetical protein
MRRLFDIDVTFISLVRKGANQKKLIWKSAEFDDEPELRQVTIRKVDEDERIIYCIVYSPEEEDLQGDISSAEEIKKAAYRFMERRRTTKVDKQHDFNPDEGFVAESWLTKSNDPLFADDPEGSWAVGIKITNDNTWKSIKKGEITGVSLAGVAREIETDNITKDDSFFTKLLKKIGIEKDFNAEYENEELRRATSALNRSIDKIIWQDHPDKKKATPAQQRDQIKKNIDQFLKVIDKIDLKKEGKVFSATNFNQIKAAHNALGELIKIYESQNKKVEKMEIDDVKKLLGESLQPVIDRLGKLEKQEPDTKPDENGKDKKPDDDKKVDNQDHVSDAIEKALKPVLTRLEKIEKASPGRQSAKGQDGDDKGEAKKGLKFI